MLLAHHPRFTTVLSTFSVAIFLLNAVWFFNSHHEIKHDWINEASSPQSQRLNFENSMRGAGNNELDITETTGLGTQADWSRFAYLQYVTAAEHTCNSVMIFESLHRLGSKAQRVLLYPEAWGDADSVYGDSSLSLDLNTRKLLVKARDEYNVILKPVGVIRKVGNESRYIYFVHS